MIYRPIIFSNPTTPLPLLELHGLLLRFSALDVHYQINKYIFKERVTLRNNYFFLERIEQGRIARSIFGMGGKSVSVSLVG